MGVLIMQMIFKRCLQTLAKRLRSLIELYYCLLKALVIVVLTCVLFLIFIIWLIDFNPWSINYLKFNNDFPPGLAKGIDIENDKVYDSYHPRQERKKSDGIWKSYKGDIDLYAYSAFYDNRLSRAPPDIKVIIVADSKIENQTVYCKVWYPQGHKPLENNPDFVTAELQNIGIGIKKNGFILKEYICSCGLHSYSALSVPQNVSLLLSQNEKAQFYLPVEIPRQEGAKGQFVLCPSIAFNKLDQYRLVEWLEIHKILGVDKVFLYSNELDTNSLRILKQYEKEGFVEVRLSSHFLLHPTSKDVLLHMSPVINDCMYRNIHKFHWMVVVDVDEMIVPHSSSNYTALFHDIEKVSAINPRFPTKFMRFQNAYFFLDLKPEDASQPKELVSLRHRMRLPPSSQGLSVKSIVALDSCVGMQNHYCWHKAQYLDDRHVIQVSPKQALLHHYKKCHLDKYLGTMRECKRVLSQDGLADDTMLGFKDALVKAVADRGGLLGIELLQNVDHS